MSSTNKEDTANAVDTDLPRDSSCSNVLSSTFVSLPNAENKDGDTESQIAARQNFEDNLQKVPLHVLEEKYDLPLKEVAEQLGVSLTMMKQICRHYKIKRWPHRQMKSITKSLNQLKDKLSMIGEDSPGASEIKRQIQLTEQKKSLITKMASRGLNAEERSLLFLSNPGELNQLLSSGSVQNDSSKASNTTLQDSMKAETNEINVKPPTLALPPTDESKYIELYGMKMHQNLASQILLHQPPAKKPRINATPLNHDATVEFLQPPTATLPDLGISPSINSSILNSTSLPSIAQFDQNISGLSISPDTSSNLSVLQQHSSYLNAPLSTLLIYSNLQDSLVKPSCPPSAPNSSSVLNIPSSLNFPLRMSPPALSNAEPQRIVDPPSLLIPQLFSQDYSSLALPGNLEVLSSSAPAALKQEQTVFQPHLSETPIDVHSYNALLMNTPNLYNPSCPQSNIDQIPTNFPPSNCEAAKTYDNPNLLANASLPCINEKGQPM